MRNNMWISLIVAVGVVAWMIYRARSRIPDISRPQFANTQEMMNWLADQAVSTAHNSYGIQFDYSTDSIEKAEQALGKLHDEYTQGKLRSGVNGMAMAFGAYVGECIRRSSPGASWSEDHPQMGEKSYPLHWRGGDSFPCAWCYRRIVNGSEDNVWNKYRILRDEVSKTPTTHG